MHGFVSVLSVPVPLIYSSVFVLYYTIFGDSLVAQTVKHLPTMGETQVQSPGWEDPLEEEMATHSNTLA